MPGLNGWSRLTRASRDAILRRVSEGAGLVLLHPFVGDVKGHRFKGDDEKAKTPVFGLSPSVVIGIFAVVMGGGLAFSLLNWRCPASLRN